MIFQGTDSVIPALTWTAHDGPINSVAWSPDGSLLASGGDDLSVGVWIPTSGDRIPDIFTSHFEPIEAVTWRPDGLQLSTAGADGRLLRWNVTNNYERLAPLETNFILTDDWNPDSSQIVVGGPDRVVRVLDAQFGGAIPLGQHRDIIRAVDWSEDGSQVGAVSDDGDVILWNADGSGEFTLARRLVGPTSLQISRDSRRIAVSYGQEIRIWDTESYILIALLRVDPGLTLQDVTWNADGTQIAAAASNGTVQVWDVPQEAPQRVSVGTPLQAHQGAINQLEWDANGERVATIGVDMALNIWDARSGVQLATLSGGHTADVISVAWSPDQRRIATGSCDNTIVLWDITNGSQIQRLEGHRGCVTNLMFTADSQILLSVDATGIIRGWNLVSYESAITPQAAHPDTVNDMIFTPDRDLFATAGEDGSVRTWALSGGNLQVVSRNQQDNVPLTSVDWGINTIMVGNTEGILRVYPYPFESTTRDELEGHTAGISGVRFSPVRQRIASIDLNGCVFLWDTTFAEKLLQRCEISAVEYRVLAWSPRGDALAIGNERGELIFWLVP
jgi:WD40 repeat protein